MRSSQLDKSRFIVGIIKREAPMDEKKQRRLTRHTFLRMSAVAGAAFVLAACAGTAPSSAPLAVPMEEQTEFDVVLVAGGENKIEVIKVVRQLTNLSLKEAQDLVDSAPARVLQAVSKEAAADAKAKLEVAGAMVEVKSGTAPSSAPLTVPMEEQTEFDVVLVAGGENKIEVIKVVRQLTNLSLKEAQDLIDSAPARVLQAVSKEAAADARAKLEEVGATVEVK